MDAFSVVFYETPKSAIELAVRYKSDYIERYT